MTRKLLTTLILFAPKMVRQITTLLYHFWVLKVVRHASCMPVLDAASAYRNKHYTCTVHTKYNEPYETMHTQQMIRSAAYM